MGVMTSETAPATPSATPTFRPCDDLDELNALPDGTALYSAGTGRVWTVQARYGGPRWSGPSGKYTFTDRFLLKESPLFVIQDVTR